LPSHQNLETALVLRVIGGFFGGTLGVVQGVIADITPPRDRAKVMGYFGAAFNFGFAVGPAIGGLLASPEQGLAGFRLPIFAAAAIAAGASLWAWWFLAETRQPGPASQNAPQLWRGCRQLRKRRARRFWRLLLIPWCGIAIFASTEAVFGLWTERAFGWTTTRRWAAPPGGRRRRLALSRHWGFSVHWLEQIRVRARVIAGGLVLLRAGSRTGKPIFHAPVATVCLMALMMAGQSSRLSQRGRAHLTQHAARAAGQCHGPEHGIEREFEDHCAAAVRPCVQPGCRCALPAGRDHHCAHGPGGYRPLVKPTAPRPAAA